MRRSTGGSTQVLPRLWPALLIAVALAFPYVQTSVRAASSPDAVFVVVNGEPLTLAVLSSYRSDIHLPSAGTSLSNRLVDDIDTVMVIQDGKARGYTLTDAQFASVLDSIKKDNRVEDPAQFASSLQAAQLTMAGLRRRLERQMIVSRMQALHGGSTTNAAEESARRYFLSHADEFSGRSFDEARDLVEQRLAGLERQERWAAYVQALESRAVMEWKDTEAQREYVVGLTERTNSRNH